MHFVWFSTNTLSFSPLLSFCFFSSWSRILHFKYAHRYFLVIWARWNNPRNILALDFDWMIGASKWQSVLLHCSLLSLLLKKSYARLAWLKHSEQNNAVTLRACKVSFYHVQTMIERILRFMTAKKTITVKLLRDHRWFSEDHEFRCGEVSDPPSCLLS